MQNISPFNFSYGVWLKLEPLTILDVPILHPLHITIASDIKNISDAFDIYKDILDINMFKYLDVYNVHLISDLSKQYIYSFGWNIPNNNLNWWSTIYKKTEKYKNLCNIPENPHISLFYSIFPIFQSNVEYFINYFKNINSVRFKTNISVVDMNSYHYTSWSIVKES